MAWQRKSENNPNVPRNYRLVWSGSAKILVDRLTPHTETWHIAISAIEHDAYLRGIHTVTRPLVVRRTGLR